MQTLVDGIQGATAMSTPPPLRSSRNDLESRDMDVDGAVCPQHICDLVAVAPMPVRSSLGLLDVDSSDVCDLRQRPVRRFCVTTTTTTSSSSSSSSRDRPHSSDPLANAEETGNENDEEVEDELDLYCGAAAVLYQPRPPLAVIRTDMAEPGATTTMHCSTIRCDGHPRNASRPLNPSASPSISSSSSSSKLLPTRIFAPQRRAKAGKSKRWGDGQWGHVRIDEDDSAKEEEEEEGDPYMGTAPTADAASKVVENGIQGSLHSDSTNAPFEVDSPDEAEGADAAKGVVEDGRDSSCRERDGEGTGGGVDGDDDDDGSGREISRSLPSPSARLVEGGTASSGADADVPLHPEEGLPGWARRSLGRASEAQRGTRSDVPPGATRPTQGVRDVFGVPTPTRSTVEAAAAAAREGGAPTSALPPLMADLDGELLQLIKMYYRRKRSATMTAEEVPVATAPSWTGTFSAATMRNDETVRTGAAPSPASGPSAPPYAPLSAGTAETHQKYKRRLSGEDEGDGLPRHTTVATGSDRRQLAGSRGVTASAMAAVASMGASANDIDSAESDNDVLSLLPPPAPSAPLASRHMHGGRWVDGGGLPHIVGTRCSSPTVPHASLRSPYATAVLGDAAATTTEPSFFHPSAIGADHTQGGGNAGLSLHLSAISSLPSYSSTSFVRAYVSDVSLSLEPALIVSALTAALNMVVVYFLQNHVLDTRDHLGVFLIGSYMVFASYYTVYYFLERFSRSFRRIASQDKKFYIIGNLIKAGILISITPFACVHLVKIIVFDAWESNILRNLGCIYAIPDFISMVIVRRMRWSTWLHHACVVLFNYVSIMNDYQRENVCRCVVVYAAFSSFAYCVNVLLASRFLGVSASVARVLSFVALVVYALCCAVNWAWQVYYLRHLLTSGHDHWTVYVYMGLITLVMWDDVILNKWLLHHARNNAYAAAPHPHPLRPRGHHHPPPTSSSPPRSSPLYRSQDPGVYTRLPPTALPPLSS